MPDQSGPRPLVGLKRRIALGVVAVLLAGGALALRHGAGNLGGPDPDRTTTSPVTEEATWVAPILAPGASFALTVEAGRRLVRIEHGAERTQQTALRGATGFASGGWATTDETVVVTPDRAGGGGRVATVLDGTGRILQRIGPGARILPGPQGWSAWIVRSAATGGTTLQGYGLDGAVRGSAAAVPAGTEPAAILRDGVVLTTQRGELSLWRLGDSEPEGLDVSGRVVSAGPGLIVVAHDCAGTCRYSLVNTATGRTTRLRTPARMRVLGEPVLSRDGLWIATMVEPDAGDDRPEAALALATVFDGGGRPTIVPGTRYRTAPGSTPVRPAWSLGGAVFGYAPGAAGLYGYQPGEAGASRLDVPGLGPVARIVAG